MTFQISRRGTDFAPRCPKHDGLGGFFPHLLVAVVAPIADALALSSSPSRRSLEARQTKVHEFLIPGLLPAGLQQRRRIPHV